MRAPNAWWSLAAVGLAAVALVAGRFCDTGTPSAPALSAAQPATSAVTRERLLAPGSRVVFALTPATFAEGEVKRIDGERVTVAHRPAGQPEELIIERARVVAVTAGATDPQPGEHLVCRTAPGTWQGCRVVQIEGARVRCEDPRGRSIDVDHAALLRPSAAMEQEIGDYLALHTRYRAFDEAVRTAGRPRRPPGWVPKRGDAVIALQTGTNWYGGVVAGMAGTSVELDWKAPTAATAVSVYDVAPPPAGPQELTVGQYGLVQRAGAELRWEPHEVVEIFPDAYLVKDRDGRPKTVAPAHIVPLVESGPSRSPDAEYIPSEPEVVDAMLELAEVQKSDVVYDLGCGDGRILVAAAKKYGARAIGYDIDPARVAESRENARRHGVEHLVRVHEADIFTVDLSNATVVALYLSDELNTRLVPQLRRLRSGARIVSHAFVILGIRPDQTVSVAVTGRGRPARNTHNDALVGASIHLWRAPLGGVTTTP